MQGRGVSGHKDLAKVPGLYPSSVKAAAKKLQLTDKVPDQASEEKVLCYTILTYHGCTGPDRNG